MKFWFKYRLDKRLHNMPLDDSQKQEIENIVRIILGDMFLTDRGGTGNTSYTKGDLLVATAPNVLSKLAVGSDNQILTADSAQTAGVKWAADPTQTPLAATGQTSRSSGDGTGNQVITHSLGRTPILIVIHYFAADGTQSSITGVGTATSTSNETCTYHYDDNTVANTDNEAGQNDTAIIAVRTGNEAGMDSGTATLSAVSTTTFTLNWTTAVAAGYTPVKFNWFVIA